MATCKYLTLFCMSDIHFGGFRVDSVCGFVAHYGSCDLGILGMLTNVEQTIMKTRAVIGWLDRGLSSTCGLLYTCTSL